MNAGDDAAKNELLRYAYELRLKAILDQKHWGFLVAGKP
jgi:hypothetical protein